MKMVMDGSSGTNLYIGKISSGYEEAASSLILTVSKYREMAPKTVMIPK
jgi:hypothetical protein